MTKRALLIEWNPNTGERAGNINPRDPKLHCNGWQNMDVEPAVELRLINDDRDLHQYENVDGVTVLTSTDEINDAIDENFESKMIIDDEVIYAAHIAKMADKIDFNSIPHDKIKRLKYLKSKHGIGGIREIKVHKI